MKRIALLAALLALAFAAVASAKIVVNHGMFGVGLGATTKQARGKLGSPTNIQRTKASETWFYAQRQLMITFRGNPRTLTDMFTMNRNQRTSKGVGVGSTKKDVKRLVHGVQCHVTPGAGTECIVSEIKGGATYGTNFHIGAHNRVDNVLIKVIR